MMSSGPARSVENLTRTENGDKLASVGASHPTSTSPTENGSQLTEEIIVDWDGPEDPENPKNWSYSQKWMATTIAASFVFISSVSSSMLSPASPQVAEQFDITSNIILQMCTSIFVLAYAFGPLFIAPLSEIYGRLRVLQAANLFFMVFNLAAGFSKNKGELIAFRFLSGLGGSGPLSVVGGILSDAWKPEERGKAIAIYSLVTLLGPSIGPLAGAWIVVRTTWRWVLWSVSIISLAIQLLAFLLLRETYAPVILDRKSRRLYPDIHPHPPTVHSTSNRTWKALYKKSLARPFVFLAMEPIVQIMSIYQAYIYGLIYLVLTTIPPVYRDIYHNSTGIGGLHYIAVGIGLTIASQTNARFIDKIYQKLKAKYGGVGRPEFRLPSMAIGAAILPIGLLLFGWTAQNHVFWLVPDIGLAIVSAGLVLSFQTIQSYLIDFYTLHAASALAAASVLRCICGFFFPLFAPSMFKHLGYGKGMTVLAGIAVGFGFPSPYLLWVYGARIRNMSRYAPKSIPPPLPPSESNATVPPPAPPLPSSSASAGKDLEKGVKKSDIAGVDASGVSRQERDGS